MKIKGYENYEITEKGEVINTTTGRILKQNISTVGYLQVNLSKNGKAKTFQVHRLVAEAFIPNPQNLPEVNHRDEDKTNNTMNNLEWCTRQYNLNYGTHNERISKTMSGVYNTKKSKTVLQLRMDGSLVRIWPSVSEVQRQLGYSAGSISGCCRGERHSAYGFKWLYAIQ